MYTAVVKKKEQFLYKLNATAAADDVIISKKKKKNLFSAPQSTGGWGGVARSKSAVLPQWNDCTRQI